MRRLGRGGRLQPDEFARATAENRPESAVAAQKTVAVAHAEQSSEKRTSPDGAEGERATAAAATAVVSHGDIELHRQQSTE